MTKKRNSENFMSKIKFGKVFSWFGIIVCSLISVGLLVCSTFYTLEVANTPVFELNQNEDLMDYVSTINNYSYYETIGTFTDIEDNFEFALFEIILPSMALLFGYILLVFTFKELLGFLKNVKKPKDLLTDKKIQIAQRCVLRTVIALLFILQNLFLWFTITVFLELLNYGFSYSLNNNKD